MMAAASFLPTSCSGILHNNFNRIPFWLQRQDKRIHGRVSCVSGKGRALCFPASSSCRLNASSGGRNDHPLSSNNEEPFWTDLIKETIWAMKSLIAFLAAQPSQLKYIEWPSFQSTLKTATLSLILVAALIVSLSTVDSALSYVLALLLRKTP